MQPSAIREKLSAFCGRLNAHSWFAAFILSAREGGANPPLPRNCKRNENHEKPQGARRKAQGEKKWNP
jgi:hypothetical protein